MVEELRIGVLASHEGTTMQAVAEACKTGQLRATICAVISNNSKSGALRRARAEGIPAHHISSQSHPGETCLDKATLEVLEGGGASLILLAGYMKKLGPRTIARFRGRVLNTHPALLPKYGGQGMYGDFVHQAVLGSGERVTGVTVHVVDGEYDHGPTIAQCTVPVREDDTVHSLGERVRERERAFLVETLQRISRRELDLAPIQPCEAQACRTGP